MKKFLSLITAGALLLSSAAFAETDATPEKTALETSMAASAVKFVTYNGDNFFAYDSMEWSSISDTLPSKFDLRERGVVPQVRDQGEWGTCWSFASIAASEISQLSTLKLTAEQFAEKYGLEMDLSERHLAWFGTNHIPEVDENNPDASYYSDQAGEGLWNVNEEIAPSASHMNGGLLGYASSVFANGMGPALERDWPYAANDGGFSMEGDWSIPESARFTMNAQLLNSNVLPSPVQMDSQFNYTYNPAGTEAIKQELLAGRGVSIQYHCDSSMSTATMCNMVVQRLTDMGLDEDKADTYARFRFGYLSEEDATEKEKQDILYAYFFTNGEKDVTDEKIQEEMKNFSEYAKEIVYNNGQTATQEQPQQEELTEEEKARKAEEEAKQLEDLKAMLKKIGKDYDEFMSYRAKVAEADKIQYMNTETYAQYTDNPYAQMSHGVTIIGWDDDYAVENFLPDHQPPAPGAWICRNSWGSAYGNDGYFYLSYYDQSISYVESFEYVFDSDSQAGIQIYTYDLMEAGGISVVQSKTPVIMANIFPLEMDSVLSDISVLTADLNANVTVGVYLLNENYQSPTDGVLLDTVTITESFAGYHRISLNYCFELPAGSVISVVERQITKTNDGLRYSIPFTIAVNKAFYDVTEAVSRWSMGVINKGESFVYTDGTWSDWSELTATAQTLDPVGALVDYDNLNIKAYISMLDGVNAAHRFAKPQTFGNYQIKICEDCGEAVVIVK